MGTTLQGIGKLAFTFTMASMYGFLVSVQMLFQILRHGSAFFHVKPRPNTPKALIDGWNHAFVKLDSGVKLHYVYAGSEDKPLMLFLHGFPEFWYSWRHQLRHFKQNYRVVAVDQRGYGDSDKPKGISNYRIEHLTRDVRDFVKALGHDSCILVAHDWGGAIAWATAAYYPEIVSKLIVMNCPNGYAFQKTLKKSWKQFFMSWYMFFFQLPFLPEFLMRSRDLHMLDQMFTDKGMGCQTVGALTAEDMEAWKYTFSKPGATTSPINWYRAAFQRLSLPEKPKSSRIGQPVLLIWGTRDGALSTEMAETSMEVCENGRVKYAQGMSHWVQQDAPEFCNAAMEEFLNA